LLQTCAAPDRHAAVSVLSLRLRITGRLRCQCGPNPSNRPKINTCKFYKFGDGHVAITSHAPVAGARAVACSTRENMQNESQLMAANGRSIKFTSERFEQIRNLVERGMSREQIAETIGVTVGSLQVTCSRHGISLKRPKLNNGVAHAPRSRNDTPAQDRRAQLALRLRYRGIDRIVELPLSEGVLGWLAIEGILSQSQH
jgi:DNA-binding transcriptional regulator YiaG